MIIKIVDRRNEHSIKNLVDYILKGNDEHYRLNDVMIDGELTSDVALTEDFINYNRQITKLSGGAEKLLHIVNSFHPTDIVDTADIMRCENQIIKDLGLEEHSRLSAVHIDQNHVHFHLAINLISPKTLKRKKLNFPAVILSKTRRFLEDELNLHKVYSKRDLLAKFIQEEVKDALLASKSFKEFKRNLARFNLALSQVGEELYFVNKDNVAVKTSVISEFLTSHYLKHKFQIEKFKTGAPVRSVDSAVKNKVLTSLQSSLVPLLHKVKSWQEVQSLLYAEGLELRKKGNGLVLFNDELELKFSELDRQLSYFHLEKKIGKFDLKQRREAKSVESNLYEEFQKSSAKAKAVMKEEALRLKKQFKKDKKLAYQRYVNSLRTYKLLGVGGVMYKLVKSQKYADYRSKLNSLIKNYKKSLDGVYSNSNTTWSNFIESKAKEGDIRALRYKYNTKPEENCIKLDSSIVDRARKSNISKKYLENIENNPVINMRDNKIKLKIVNAELLEEVFMNIAKLQPSIDLQGNVKFQEKMVELLANSSSSLKLKDKHLEKKRYFHKKTYRKEKSLER